MILKKFTKNGGKIYCAIVFSEIFLMPNLRTANDFFYLNVHAAGPNIGNMVVKSDLNLLSVVSYSKARSGLPKEFGTLFMQPLVLVLLPPRRCFEKVTHEQKGQFLSWGANREKLMKFQ